MAKRTKKDKKFVIKCSHCFSDDFKLDDVKPDDELKFYTDTPFKCTRTAGGPDTKKENLVIPPPKVVLEDGTLLMINQSNSAINIATNIDESNP